MASLQPHLSEGHSNYCRACGHDLPGLSGERCPACGRTIHWRRDGRPDGASGRWLAVGVVGLGVVLALVGVKYRRFEGKPPPGPATKPAVPAVTSPA